ncbi:DUF1176 domain-containing protein [Mesorhizobium sp. KR9-304]|uniref:DUF1176 domain-containing protein n=1 Tax=Mesorhizobium sp. KR9-304 TaxID=3156614 RepID=UPI0032B4956F
MRPLPLALASAVLLRCLSGVDAFAQETRYIDDRSSAATIVKSLYNSVNRKEYARAWDYFGDEKPATDFKAFADGYASTERVDVEIGAVSEEGAAGSIFYSVPVAIRAVGADGSEKVFAGCYTARQVNAQIQEPPFRPLHIDKGSLKPADGDLVDALPAQCGDTPPAKTDAAFEQAKAAFAASHAEQCEANGGARADDPSNAPQAYPISYHYKTDAEGAEPRQARLFRFYCSMGAYNEVHIYYVSDEISGVNELHFAEPELDIRYENDNSEGKVESITVIGFRSSGELINSFYDEATMSISSHAKWRGVGDAASSGTWIFRDGAFALVNYEVDASYDGEINPETVVDYNTPP